MTKTHLIGCAAALVLAVAAGGGVAVARSNSNDGYKNALLRIELKRKADDRACERLRDGARELCRAESGGRESVARAQLQARHKPGPKSEQDVKDARAEADFRIARIKCASGPATAKDRCIDQAKSAHEAALREAMVEKVQRMAEDARHARPGHVPKPETAEQRYASLKAYCSMQGPDRDRCLDEAKRRFHKS